MIRPYELHFPLEDFPLFAYSDESGFPLRFAEVTGLAIIEFDGESDWKLAKVILNETPSWDEETQSWRERKLRISCTETDWPKRRLFNWTKLALVRSENERIEERIREMLSWEMSDA